MLDFSLNEYNNLQREETFASRFASAVFPAPPTGENGGSCL